MYTKIMLNILESQLASSLFFFFAAMKKKHNFDRRIEFIF